MDERDKRLAQNEALFREVNERIEALAIAQTQGDGDTYEFLCECTNTDCTFQLPVPLRDYERVRADARRFIVKPGHNLPEVEKIAEQHDAFWVVEKEDEAGAYVEHLDPRGRQ